MYLGYFEQTFVPNFYQDSIAPKETRYFDLMMMMMMMMSVFCGHLSFFLQMLTVTRRETTLFGLGLSDAAKNKWQRNRRPLPLIDGPAPFRPNASATNSSSQP